MGYTLYQGQVGVGLATLLCHLNMHLWHIQQKIPLLQGL